MIHLQDYIINDPVYIYNLESKIPQSLEQETIGRYFTLSGFLDLFGTRELRFTRISEFEDKAEGIPQYNKIIEGMKTSRKYVGDEYYDERKKNIIRTIDNYYASCWTMKSTESYLLWKAYSNYYEGILVLTTIKKLHDSIIFQRRDNGIVEMMFFGEVDYGYNKKMISDHFKAFGKSDFFKDETEFRFVIYHHPICIDIYKRCELKRLNFINKIICSPGASTFLIEQVERVAKEYGLASSLVRESDIKQDNTRILDDFLSPSDK